ncbi:MAG: hypothetical protein ABI873_17075 [Marmoricola sp.]
MGNTRYFTDADQVKDGCGHPDTKLVVKPVIDLNEHLHVGAYEVPERFAEQATLVDVQCAFPDAPLAAWRRHP